MVADSVARTVSELLSNALRGDTETPIVFVSRDGQYDRMLRDILDDALACAGGLAARGVGPGTKVAMQLPNNEESLVVQLAVCMLGAVCVPIVPIFGIAELTHMLRDARPHVLVMMSSWRNIDYRPLIADIPSDIRPPHVIVVGEDVDGTAPYSDLAASGDRLREVHPAEPDDPVLIIYTSGSSGTPKGVVHTHGSIAAEAREYQYASQNGGNPSVVGGPEQLQATGAGHIGGVTYPMRILMHGNHTMVLDWWDTTIAARMIDRYRITLFACTPFHLASIMDVADAEGLDLSCLKHVVVGGGPVSPRLIERADAAGIIAVRGYGSSEHPTLAIGNFDAPLDVRANTEGPPSPWSEIRLVGDDGVDVAPGEPGEVLSRGADMFSHYTNLPRSETFTSDGWFRTGDIGRMDASGVLTIVDRKKNIIIRGGENISIAEVELAFTGHPDIAEAAVFGLPDERYGERVCIVVVPRDGREVSLAVLNAYASERGLARQKLPEILEVTDSLPYGGLQKVRRDELKQRYLAKHAATQATN